jgi:hypothetical protein
MTSRFAFGLSRCALMAVLAGCAGTAPAFSTRFPDNRESDVQALLQRLESAPPTETSMIAVGLSSAPTKLYAFDPQGGRVLWSEASSARYAPIVTGDVDRKSVV